MQFNGSCNVVIIGKEKEIETLQEHISSLSLQIQTKGIHYTCD